MNDNNIKFQFVSVYVVGQGGNLSVGAPFCRGCPKRTIHVIDANTRVNGPSLSLDEIAAYKRLLNISSFSEFNSLYDKLFSTIKAKQLGKNHDNEMSDILQKLKIRIINNIDSSQKSDFEEKCKQLYDMALNGVHDFKIGTAGIKK